MPTYLGYISAACNGTWSVQFEGKCYVFSLKTTTKTWSDARIDCKGMNHTYDLAVIDDAGVDNFVSNFASQHYDDPYEVWIGLSDTKTEGYFQWVGGSKPKYTNWHNGEPNGKSVIEVYTCLIGMCCQ